MIVKIDGETDGSSAALVVTICHSCLFLITPWSRSTLSGTHWQLSVGHNNRVSHTYMQAMFDV